MSLPAPAPVKPDSPATTSNGHPPSGGNGHMGGNGRGNGHGGSGSGGPGGSGGTGWPGEAPQPGEPDPRRRQRRSFWPFLLDLGLALAMFDLIILRQGLVVVGAVLAVVALAGWIREARADYARLKD